MNTVTNTNPSDQIDSISLDLAYAEVETAKVMCEAADNFLDVIRMAVGPEGFFANPELLAELDKACLMISEARLQMSAANERIDAQIKNAYAKKSDSKSVA